MKEVRTRFAPSPTGGLHVGGVRTALYSYLYAKKFNGKFILRVEDTDQNRYVEGAEQYIIDCLDWCGLHPDEDPIKGGEYEPYRQSERKEIYKRYAMQLIENGHAYYAFDTTDELEKMREENKSSSNPSPQYDHNLRMKMKNSLNLLANEVEELLQMNIPFVVRLKVPENKIISFEDMIRGEISNDSNLLDDKVLLKADGMPTYHLAVVVDDYLMKISHAFRGEEWLPSAPIHILLWQYLGWEKDMPHWAHLPLILKPDGNGKLSKRDGTRLGFPVFAMDWKDINQNEIFEGYKEKGFMPQAFVNMLAMLGWNSGKEQEIFSMQELIDEFSIERVHKGGAKFDYEKAKWFNHEWIKNSDVNVLFPYVKNIFDKENIEFHSEEKLKDVIAMVKDRCTLLNDFVAQANYFFQHPKVLDLESIQPKWNDEKKIFFDKLIEKCNTIDSWNESDLESIFKNLASEKNIKVGEVMMPFRVMLVGGKFGPGVFHIAHFIGKEETILRIKNLISNLS